MPKLILSKLPNPSSTVASQHYFRKLSLLIDQFNEAEPDGYLQLCLLQQIDAYSRAIIDRSETDFFEPGSKECRNPGFRQDVYKWHYQQESTENESSLHDLLQHFGIHRDASFSLKAAEYSIACARLLKIQSQDNETVHSLHKQLEDRLSLTAAGQDSSEVNGRKPNSIEQFYELMEERFLILQNLLREAHQTDAEEEASRNYNQLLMTHLKMVYLIENSDELRELLENHMAMLSLVQAEMEIRALGMSKGQHFPNQKIGPLNKRQVNNHNYFFNLSAEKEDEITLVIREEDRDNQTLEHRLLSNRVARFFAQDYGNMMRHSENHMGDHYQPIVISQLAKQGNLVQLCKKTPTEQIASEAQIYFSQITEFCQELVALDVFHPDIKLTNFLVENNRILVSDRKALLRGQKANIKDIRTSPLYTPPEIRVCVNNRQGVMRAFKSIDLLPSMSYQIGIALKEFLLKGDSPLNLLSTNLLKAVKHPSDAHLNLIVLSEALTRGIPTQRISLGTCLQMLSSDLLNLPPQQFLAKLNEVEGRDVFAIRNALTDLFHYEAISFGDLEQVLQPYGSSLSLFLDPDVEKVLLRLFKEKPISGQSFSEVGQLIETLQNLVEQNSVEDRCIYAINDALDKAEQCMKAAEATKQDHCLPLQLLKRSINQIQKDYRKYLQIIAVRKLSARIAEKPLCPEDWKSLSSCLNSYLGMDLNRESSRFKEAFTKLKTQSGKLIQKEIDNFNYQQAGFFEKLWSWLRLRPIPNRLTKEEFETNPNLKHCYDFLKSLDQSKLTHLLKDKSTFILSFLEVKENDSADKMKKLNKGSSSPKPKEEDDETATTKIANDEGATVGNKQEDQLKVEEHQKEQSSVEISLEVIAQSSTVSAQPSF
ncbi:protein kinase domain containing protein [Legionella jordanis]|uniref:Protein kinase domain containing protein n=1 Tax=Legionella jordanis TaxID=456 RepID=A0A0W0V858_9GAMM|nr:hypothetical protein [Legionella jordanis]KTD16321.1 protein kinase domain containing protein [Legionella jordanis]VEH12221.1 protein kinase domain containing protein [Legionella jordanis]